MDAITAVEGQMEKMALSLNEVLKEEASKRKLLQQMVASGTDHERSLFVLFFSAPNKFAETMKRMSEKVKALEMAKKVLPR